jgi:hypothetical protein
VGGFYRFARVYIFLIDGLGQRVGPIPKDRSLRSFGGAENQDQQIAAFGNSYGFVYGFDRWRRSWRSLRSFGGAENQDQQIAACGSSYGFVYGFDRWRRSWRSLRSFGSAEYQDQQIAAFGSSYDIAASYAHLEERSGGRLVLARDGVCEIAIAGKSCSYRICTGHQ